MSTRHGLGGTALAYWREYASAGLGAVTASALLSIPAAGVVWGFFPDTGPLFVLAVLSFGLHLGAAFVRDVWRGEYEPGENTDVVLENTFSVIGILVLYVGPLMLLASVGGLHVGRLSGASLLGLAVALYYPVGDYELLKRGIPTPSSLPVFGLFALLHAVGLCRDVSPKQVIRRFRRRPPMPRTG